MALALAMVVDGLGLLVRALWGRQERRFSATSDAVSSTVVSVAMALVLCFLSIHAHARPEIGLAFI